MDCGNIHCSGEKRKLRIIMKKWKQLLTVVLSAGMMCLAPVSAFAAVDLNARYEISTNAISGWPAGPEITSDTGVLMDADSGILLYNKGGDELRYPASITKIMTLLLAVENSSLDDQVTFTETGVRDVTWDSGNIGMQVGEVMSMEDCIYALIIQSANEVAAQIAEYVGGTEQNFIDMMNQRAAEIGCTNTHFANASGLPDENHYSTARDMALIMREALKNKTFCKIIGTPTYTIQPTNMNSEPRRLHTHHPMFASETTYYYKGCIGGKTGFTNDAGSTLVTAVKRKKGTYIAVTMKAQELGYAVADSTALFDYAYQNFTKKKVEGGKVLIPNDLDLNSLTVDTKQKGDKELRSYYFGDYLVGTAKVSLATPTPEPVSEDTESGQDTTADGKTDAGKDSGEKSEAVSQESTDEEGDSLTDGKKTALNPTEIFLLIMAAIDVLLVIILAVILAKKKRRR